MPSWVSRGLSSRKSSFLFFTLCVNRRVSCCIIDSCTVSNLFNQSIIFGLYTGIDAADSREQRPRDRECRRCFDRGADAGRAPPQWRGPCAQPYHYWNCHSPIKGPLLSDVCSCSRIAHCRGWVLQHAGGQAGHVRHVPAGLSHSFSYSAAGMAMNRTSDLPYTQLILCAAAQENASYSVPYGTVSYVHPDALSTTPS